MSLILSLIQIFLSLIVPHFHDFCPSFLICQLGSSALLFYCRNEKTAVSISLVIDYKSNSCIPFRNTGEVLKSLLCVVCVLKVHATSSSDTVRHTVLVERWTNSLSSDRCLILKMNSLFFDFSDFF